MLLLPTAGPQGKSLVTLPSTSCNQNTDTLQAADKQDQSPRQGGFRQRDVGRNTDRKLSTSQKMLELQEVENIARDSSRGNALLS